MLNNEGVLPPHFGIQYSLFGIHYSIGPFGLLFGEEKTNNWFTAIRNSTMQKILFFQEKLPEKLASSNTVLYLVLVFEQTLRKQRNPIMKQATPKRGFYSRTVSPD